MIDGQSKSQACSTAQRIGRKGLTSGLLATSLIALVLLASGAAVVFGSAVVFAAVALTAGICCVLFGASRPRLILGYMILVSSTTGALRDVGEVHFGSTAVSLFGLTTACITAGAVLFLLFHWKDVRRRWLYDFLPFWLFSVIALGRSFGSSAGTEGWRQAFLVMAPLLIPVVTTMVLTRDPAAFHWIERTLIFTAFVAIGVLLATLSLGYMQSSTEGFISIFGRRNVALYMMLMLAFGLAQWRYGETPRQKKIGFCLSTVTLIIILSSLSRTTSTIALLFLVPMCFVRISRRRAWVSLLAAPALGAALLVLLLLWAPVRARFLGEGVNLSEGGDLESDYADLNTSGRNEMWAATFFSGIQKPFFGHGTGTASELIELVVPGLDHPHNDYLRVFHDQGLIGLAVFLWAWMGRSLRHWKKLKSSEAVPTAVRKYRMIGFLIAVSVSLSFLTDNLMLYEYMMMPSFLLLAMSDFLERKAVVQVCEFGTPALQATSS